MNPNNASSMAPCAIEARKLAVNFRGLLRRYSMSGSSLTALNITSKIEGRHVNPNAVNNSRTLQKNTPYAYHTLLEPQFEEPHLTSATIRRGNVCVGHQRRVGCCFSLSATVYVSSNRYQVPGMYSVRAEHYAAVKLERSLAMSATADNPPPQSVRCPFSPHHWNY